MSTHLELLAWIDWPAFHSTAGQASDNTHAVLLVASAIAHQGQHLQTHDRRALRVAADHLAS